VINCSLACEQHLQAIDAQHYSMLISTAQEMAVCCQPAPGCSRRLILLAPGASPCVHTS
jgi:hypothetical protein